MTMGIQIDAIIRDYGGGKAIASELGIRETAVSNWKRNGLPARHIERLHELTGIPYDQLFKLTKPPKDRAA